MMASTQFGYQDIVTVPDVRLENNVQFLNLGGFKMAHHP